MLRRVVTILGAVIVCSLCYTCGLGFGVVVGEFNGYKKRTEEERAVIAPVLADPAFAGLVLEDRSNGGVLVYGTLSVADRERLKLAVTRAVGETRGREVIGGVDVRR